MKRPFYYIAICLMLSMAVVSCSKEEVQPFNPASPGASLIDKTGETGGTTTTTTDAAAVSGGDSNSGEVSGGDITDGGNSSDYDSKGKRRPTRP